MILDVPHFGHGDLDRLVRIVANGWRVASDLDWTVRAGALDWDCIATADYVVDTVLAPAFFLASRKSDGYPGFAPFTMRPGATPRTLADGLETAGRVLSAVVAAAEPDATAVIWRRPVVETRTAEDFVPRGALELILHAHDIGVGLGSAFDPPTDLCERLRSHTRDWPFWTTLPNWSPLTMAGDPWADLLCASGRTPPTA
jgi:hypothetical protein